MIHSRKEKIFENLFLLLLISFFIICIILFLIFGYNIFGSKRGLLFSASFIVILLATMLSLLLSLKDFSILYILTLPFFLRLNVTRFYFELFQLKFHLITVSIIFFITVGTLKIFIEGKFPKTSDIKDFLLNYSFVLMITSGIVSSLITETAVGGDKFVSFFSTIFAFLIPFFIFFIFSNAFNTINDIKTVLLFFIFSFFLNTISGFLNIVTKFDLVELFLNRASFNFIGPNVYAATALIFVPVTFYFLSEEKGIKKFLFFIFFIFINLSILMTISRGGLLSLVLIYFLFFFMVKDFRKNVAILFYISSGIGALTFGLLFNVISRFFNIFTRAKVTEFSTLIRVNAWQLSLHQIPHHPFGIGGNQFPKLWRNLGAFPEQLVLHSHNLILGLTLEYGIIATVGFVFLNGYLLYNLYKISKKFSGTIKNISISFFISILSFFFMGTISEGPRAHLNNERFLTNDPLIIYYMFLGIVYSFLKVVSNEKKDTIDSTS
ncbi:MAG: O-antigen ligase family protein [candidate division WOR-3 bacterium]